MIFSFVARLAAKFGLLFAIINVAWIFAAHRFQPSLPRLLYSQGNLKALYIWEADCPSLLATCPRERYLLDGLNIHPVAQWSPDGQYIAVYLAEAWAIYPADCLLGERNCKSARFDPTANDNRVAWGPDGSTLAYIADSSSATLKILTRGCWDKSLQQNCLKQTITIIPKGVLRQAAWSAGGNRFAFQGLQPSGLYVLEAACLDEPESCPDEVRSLAVNMVPAYWPSLSADGRQLLYHAETVDGVEQIYIAQVDSGDVQQISFRAGGGSVPVWSHDGRYIAFAGFQNRSGGDLGIYLFDMERRLTARAIQQRGQDFVYPSWSPIP